MSKYSLEDVAKSYKWLGHRAFTELNAYHPDYKPGKENLERNLKNKALPKIWYARKEQDVLYFVEKYGQSHTVCYGINSRPKIFKNINGFPRSAKESEIDVSQNLLSDFDFLSKKPTNEQIAAFELFLQKAEEYFLDLGLKPPVRAYTGGGYHLLFAYPEIKVKDCPDIADRLKEFCGQFNQAYRQDLERLEVKLDKTQDLRRMVRIYGTAKPKVGIISRFYGEERIEDEKLRDYLLSMKLTEPKLGDLVLRISNELPQWFQSMIERDRKLKELWSGDGKPESTDTTRSGYDYSIVRKLMQLGYKNIDELATILALRPEGAVRNSGKDERYIRRTIANALLK